MGLNPTGGSNRNLIDYFQVSFDPLGAAVVAYTDDHNDFDGNTFVARQISGPSIRGGNLPAVAEGSALGPPPPTVRVPAGDVFPPAQPGPGGEQVTDFLLDVQTALLTRVPTPDAIDIESIKYETVGSRPDPGDPGHDQGDRSHRHARGLVLARQFRRQRAPLGLERGRAVTASASRMMAINFICRPTPPTRARRVLFTAPRCGNRTAPSLTPRSDRPMSAHSIPPTDTITMKVSLTKLNAVLSAASRPLIATGSVIAGLRGRAVTRMSICHRRPAGRAAAI